MSNLGPIGQSIASRSPRSNATEFVNGVRRPLMAFEHMRRG